MNGPELTMQKDPNVVKQEATTLVVHPSGKFRQLVLKSASTNPIDNSKN